MNIKTIKDLDGSTKIYRSFDPNPRKVFNTEKRAKFRVAILKSILFLLKKGNDKTFAYNAEFVKRCHFPVMASKIFTKIGELQGLQCVISEPINEETMYFTIGDKDIQNYDSRNSPEKL